MASKHTEGEHAGHHWCSSCGMQMCDHCGWFGECMQCHFKEGCPIVEVDESA